MAEWQPPKLDNLKHGFVDNEGCKLYYTYCGQGPLLLYIPGAGAQSPEYLPMIPYLQDQFTCVSYDRRQCNRSTKAPDGSPMVFKPWNPIQQARDAVAVIHAMGASKALVLGNSAGGVIALQVAASFPEVIDRIIVHEAPTLTILPDSDLWIDRIYSYVDLFKTSGLKAAMGEFRQHFQGYSASDAPTPQASDEDWTQFWTYEMLPVTTYVPDLKKVRDNGVSIAIGTGVKSGDAFYAKTCFPLSERIGCSRFDFPGHHSGHQCEPEEFAGALVKAFEVLGEQRKKT